MQWFYLVQIYGLSITLYNARFIHVHRLLVCSCAHSAVVGLPGTS